MYYFRRIISISQISVSSHTQKRDYSLSLIPLSRDRLTASTSLTLRDRTLCSLFSSPPPPQQQNTPENGGIFVGLRRRDCSLSLIPLSRDRLTASTSLTLRDRTLCSGSHPPLPNNKIPPKTGVFLLAEKEGFEPSVRINRTTDFESAAFDHSATSPKRNENPLTNLPYTVFLQKKQ